MQKKFYFPTTCQVNLNVTVTVSTWKRDLQVVPHHQLILQKTNRPLGIQKRQSAAKENTPSSQSSFMQATPPPQISTENIQLQFICRYSLKIIIHCTPG